jgi:hypothetical protein
MTKTKPITVLIRMDQVKKLDRIENKSAEVRKALDYYWATSPGTPKRNNA